MGAWIEIRVVYSSESWLSVAPLVGAWIEITVCRSFRFGHFVAPLVGAWIEIMTVNCYGCWMKSLPSWERGLKYFMCEDDYSPSGRSPRGSVDWNFWSDVRMEKAFSSLPSWERGLKFLKMKTKFEQERVAPLVGAWIEIWILFHASRKNPVAPLVGAWIEICM